MKLQGAIAACGFCAMGAMTLGQGCARTTCAVGDAECYVDFIEIQDANGKPLDVVIVPSANIKPSGNSQPVCNGLVCASPNVCITTSTPNVCAKTCNAPNGCPSGQTCLTTFSPNVCGTVGVAPSCPASACPLSFPICFQGQCYTSPDLGTPQQPMQASDAPQITNTPEPLTFDSAGGSVTVELDFTDPLGCQPSFCFTPCPKNAKCASRSVCTHSAKDGKLVGSVIMRLAPKYEPADGGDSIDMQVTPAVSPDCGDAAGALLNGDGSAVRTGDQIHITVTVEAPPVSSSGSTTNEKCSDFGGGGTGCANCSIQACVSASSDGSCSAYYRGSDGSKVSCASCSSCQAAAQSIVGHCCPVP